ncbi:MAG: glutaredoxin 3 [Thiohalocapsa sp.]|jgi:glutaredoxin 3|uniref:glutaredoxin 3 n=1 Tax=Thiohalocapsa sp. TaxID=2497641 RepID=UPI0025CEAB49|nr:glutaredoxin 3 [Thiohalocapsa sp.]MCG6940205.1 glutaredoxin 3 [Thiohalocapsa sp.]
MYPSSMQPAHGPDASTDANQPRVRMYATAFCPYCVRARRLLERKGVEWEEISIDGDRERFQEMTQLSHRTTVPQIFIGDVHVGGYDDMAALDRAGKLDPLLFGR